MLNRADLSERDNGFRAGPEESRPPRVGVIVLHWNAVSETRQCVESLRNINYPNFMVFLIDNGSTLALEEFLDKEESGVQIIRSNENLGFSGGCNIGIRASIEAECDFVWLLNNDTTVHPDALMYLVKKAEVQPLAGIIGSTILEQEDKNVINHMGGRINPFVGRCFHLEQGKKYSEFRSAGIATPSYVTGCSLLARVAMAEEVGLLDEGYFLYWEDADWCVRARRHGWGIAIADDSLVYHAGSGSLGSMSILKGYFLARNSIRFILKFYPWLAPLAIFWWPRWHFINHILRGRFQHAKMSVRGLSDFFMRRVIIPNNDQNSARTYRKV